MSSDTPTAVFKIRHRTVGDRVLVAVYAGPSLTALRSAGPLELTTAEWAAFEKSMKFGVDGKAGVTLVFHQETDS